jgi:glycosyltransferase involved in cell wall biosynthesis
MISELKVSIITVVYNNSETIADCIDSVLNQSYPNIEYIIIDGASTDGIVDVVNKYGNKITTFISEPDKGLYDAMNKGINLSTGDIVGIISSDDLYIDNKVIENVIKEFEEKDVDSVYADLVYVSPGNLDKILRHYDSSYFNPQKGWMPAHPTFFVKKEVYEKYGVFRTDLKIAADFDILIRFLHTYKISYSYMQEVLVKMRTGGVSTSFSGMWINNLEQLQVCRDNNIDTNIFKIFLKYPRRILGYLKRNSIQ